MSELNRSFYLWLLQFVFFLGLLVLLLWLSPRPKKPRYTIVELDVSTANATTITFGMEISNPNKRAGVYYDDMNVTVILISDVADDTAGCYTTINGFYQGHHKTATRGMSLASGRAGVGAGHGGCEEWDGQVPGGGDDEGEVQGGRSEEPSAGGGGGGGNGGRVGWEDIGEDEEGEASPWAYDRGGNHA